MGPAPTPSVSLLVVFAIAGVVALLGAWLLIVGGWPRRRGDEPHCRACNYNLTGLTSDRCPECGGALTPATTVRGVRHRRPVLIVVGILLLLLAPAPLVPAVREIKWYRLRPTGWVLGDLQSGSAGVSDKAWYELMRRAQGGGLSEAHLRRLIGLCLAEQGTPPPATPRSQWVAYLGDCFIRSILTEAEEERFIRQAVWMELRVRPRIVTGQPLAYELTYHCRCPSGTFWIETRDGEAAIDSQPVREFASGGGRAAGVGAAGRVRGSCPCHESGRHTLAISVPFRLYRGSPGDEHATTLLDERTVALRAEFEALPEAPPDLIRALDDPSQGEALRSLIEIKDASWDGHRLKFVVRVTAAPPIPIAFDVLVRDGVEERLVGSHAQSRNEGAFQHNFSYRPAAGGPPPSPITVILRGSRDVALQTVDLYEYWAGALVFEDIPLQTSAEDR